MTWFGRRLRSLAGLYLIWSFLLLPLAAVSSSGPDSGAIADGSERSCTSDCPGDDENGECSSECDACPCCPTAASPAVSPGGPSAAGLAVPRTAGRLPSSGQAREGALSRVFHPPRPDAARLT